jgi:hypothetical protein
VDLFVRIVEIGWKGENDMPTLSRHMPKMERGSLLGTFVWWLLCSLFYLAFGAWLASFLWLNPIFILPVILFVILFTISLVVDSRKYRLRMEALAQEREGESICTFAKAFDLRKTDSWIVRGAYDQFQNYFTCDGPNFPFRASDRLTEDLHMDGDEVENVMDEVCLRAGRSFEETENNPFYDKVNTVGDLVHFLNAQPRITPVG